MIELKGIKKEFGEKKIFKNLSLSIEKGDFIAFTGPSGAGKTTLLNLIGLLDDEYLGSYILDGKNIGEMHRNELNKFRNDHLAFVFQAYLLIDYLTVYDNIVLPLRYQKKKVSKEKIEKIIERLGISELVNKKAMLLSGGEKQRVAIARAMVQEPLILLADEPTGNLDEGNTSTVVKYLKELNKEFGITVIIVTHNTHILSEFNHVYEIKDFGIKEITNV